MARAVYSYNRRPTAEVMSRADDQGRQDPGAVSGGVQPLGDRGMPGHPLPARAQRAGAERLHGNPTQPAAASPGGRDGRFAAGAGANGDWAGRSGGDSGGLSKALEVNEGDYIVMHMDGEELRVVNDEKEFERAREVLAKYVPEGVSLVDELIADRRREAAAEEAM